MHHLLLSYKMSRLVYNLHELVYIVWPVIQNVIWILIPPEVNNSSETIDLCSNRLVDYEIGQKFLRFLNNETCLFYIFNLLKKILSGNNDRSFHVPESNTHRFR